MIRKSCKYEWKSGLCHKGRIYDFLVNVDETFVPKLSGRVDIEIYAQKLAQYADNLFAVIDGADVASCSIYCNETVAYISSIAVKANFGRAHIGTKMMNEVKRHAKERECEKICLEVNRENIVAETFYKSCGFVIVDFREDWVVMSYIL